MRAGAGHSSNRPIRNSGTSATQSCSYSLGGASGSLISVTLCIVANLGEPSGGVVEPLKARPLLADMQHSAVSIKPRVGNVRRPKHHDEARAGRFLDPVERQTVLVEYGLRARRAAPEVLAGEVHPCFADEVPA